MWARNVIKNIVLNHLAVMILGCMIAGSPRKLSQNAKNPAPAAKLCMYFFFKKNSDTHFSLFIAARTNLFV